MASPFSLSHNALPKALSEPHNHSLLTGILRGVEKESLRVTNDGQLSMTNHPPALGAALTHPQITTDFSEALVEFITSPTHHVDSLLEHLEQLHWFSYQHLPHDEMLWNHSMPCALSEASTIPVARYGNTNRARMKTLYRVGLGHRYGRTMQTVAGVHFNFSLPNAFWAFMQQRENNAEDFDSYRTRRYFALTRNFRRQYWLLIYLFGASPAISKSFVNDREHSLEVLKEHPNTLYLPYATSLRMGDLGYQSEAQEQLYVCYNSLATYVQTLSSAIFTPYPTYSEFGLKGPSGDYLQLNTSLLQIENEFYSSIRPKRTAKPGETALTALCRRGVEYIEVRCLDIDPFNDLGIGAEQIHFLDTFLLYCALQESPECDTREFKTILANQKAVVTEGRKPGLELTLPDGTGSIPLKTWGEQLLQALEPVAELLDECHGSEAYSQALAAQKVKMENPEKTPSAKVLAEVKNHAQGFTGWANDHSHAIKARYIDKPLPADISKKFEDMTEESLMMRRAEEDQPQEPFAEYLQQYYAQYNQCCRANLDH